MAKVEQVTIAQPGGDCAPPANPDRRAGRIALTDIYALLLDPTTRPASVAAGLAEAGTVRTSMGRQARVAAKKEFVR